MITTDKLNWYAAYTRVNQELVIKKKLDELGVENYLPQEERVRELHSVERRLGCF